MSWEGYDRWKTTDPRGNEPDIGDTPEWSMATSAFEDCEIAKAQEILSCASEEYGDSDENWYSLLSEYTYVFSGRVSPKPRYLQDADELAYIILRGLAIGTPQDEDDRWAVQQAKDVLLEADGELIAAELLRQRFLERVEGHWLLTSKGHDALRQLCEIKRDQEE